MADHTFKYPDVSAPTTTLTFPRCFFKGDVGYSKANQLSAITPGGTHYAQSQGNNQKIQKFTIEVPIASSSETDWTDVDTFINDIVNYAINPFYWTDDVGTVRQVIMTNTDSEPEEMATYRKYTFQLIVLSETPAV